MARTTTQLPRSQLEEKQPQEMTPQEQEDNPSSLGTCEIVLGLLAVVALSLRRIRKFLHSAVVLLSTNLWSVSTVVVVYG